MQDYAAVLYGGHWWIGLGNRQNFFRSKNEIYDSTWTTENILLACSFSNILKIVNSLTATPQCGHTYQLSDFDFKAICKLLEQNINNHTED